MVRARRWVAVAAVGVAAAGCGHTRDRQARKPGDSLLASAFAGHPQFTPPAAPPAAGSPWPAAGGSKEWSADTLVSFADVEAEAALAPDRPAADRDRLADAARQKYQAALAKDGSHKAARVGLANLYARLGDRPRAVEAYQSAIAAAPTDHALMHGFAAVLARFEDWPGAERACRRALDVDPENRTYRKTLGYCLARQDRWDESFDVILRVMPEAQARYFLGRTLLDLNRPAEGRQQMELALQTDPSHGPAKEVLTALDRPPAADPAAPNAGVVRVQHTDPVR